MRLDDSVSQTTNTATTYAADGITAGISNYPLPKPVMDTVAFVEACRVQARTWVTRVYGVRVPESLSGAGALADLIAEVADAAEHDPQTAKGDVTENLSAYLDTAHTYALWAYHDHGDGYLLGVLFCLIKAAAAQNGGVLADTGQTDPFGGRTPLADEAALIETVRAQLNTWAPDLLGTPSYGQITGAPAVSDVIAEVLDAAQARYGDLDDGDSIRGMAHLANARAYGLKAGYGHGDAYVFAALGSLVLAAANLA